MYFHCYFVTLISICYNGTPEERIKFAPALDILLMHILKYPSVLNYKVIEVEIPNMMLRVMVAPPAIKYFFQSCREESGIQSEYFFEITVDDLPTHYNMNGDFVSYYKVD